MNYADLNKIKLHYEDTGPRDGKTLLFANSHGTDLRLWDPIIPYLPKSLRLIRFDKRGHGLSECPVPPYSMDSLIEDVASLVDHLKVQSYVFVGLSIGGMITQGLAVKRPNQVKAMVLSNTGTKIGNPSI